jgi:uncharacterized protein YdeI (YjbR/CyaY-like superfamily)
VNVGETLYVHRRADWRRWLRANFRRKTEIWLVLPHKASGRPGLVYKDAVEEALCFGWIDGLKKKGGVDEAVQRFTPRRPRSPFSQPNRERLRRLLEERRVHPSIRAAAEAVVRQPFVFPEDVLGAIRRNKIAWAWFRRQSAPYRRIRVAWVDAARRRPDEFRKRLRNLVRASATGEILGEVNL